MKTHQKYLLLFILLMTLAGCKESFLNSDEEMLNAAFTEFPQLKNGKAPMDGYYVFVKSIVLAKPGVQIRLFKPKSFAGDNRQIVVILNSKGEFCPIPVLDNKYKTYWNFLYDAPSPQTPSMSTTFEKEVNKALDKLQLNIGIDGALVINELFISALSCRIISVDDLNTIKKVNFDFGETDLPNDNDDSCHKRNELNYNDINKLMHPRKYEFDMNAYFDGENNRIYQLENIKSFKAVKQYYKIRVYRQGCVVHFLTL